MLALSAAILHTFHGTQTRVALSNSMHELKPIIFLSDREGVGEAKELGKRACSISICVGHHAKELLRR